MNTYTPDELVRIELLQYPVDSDQLHPVEYKWRMLAKKLFEDVRELEKAILAHGHYNDADGKTCFKCKLGNLPRKFPEPYKGD